MNSKKIPYITSKQMAKVDELAIGHYGLSVPQMMENAGANFARFVSGLRPQPKKIIVFFGKGNNGGDGVAASRHLAISGIKVELISASPPGELNRNVKNQLEILSKAGIKPVKSFRAKKGDLIVDALLGYNLVGAPRGKYADLIHGINFMKRSLKNGLRVVSFDIPSGMGPDTGECFNPCVKADYTLTLALPKTGLKKGRTHVGKLYLVNLGIPNELYKRYLRLNIGTPFRDRDVVKV